jgi:hypothetical protein
MITSTKTHCPDCPLSSVRVTDVTHTDYPLCRKGSGALLIDGLNAAHRTVNGINTENG